MLPLIWAVGMVDLLPYPDQPLDVDWLCDFFRSARAGSWRGAVTRDPGEILDEADLIYRYHWATRNAELYGEPAPAALDRGVVMERHHALNWLIGYGDAPWDKVTCDT